MVPDGTENATPDDLKRREKTSGGKIQKLIENLISGQTKKKLFFRSEAFETSTTRTHRESCFIVIICSSQRQISVVGDFTQPRTFRIPKF